MSRYNSYDNEANWIILKICAAVLIILFIVKACSLSNFSDSSQAEITVTDKAVKTYKYTSTYFVYAESDDEHLSLECSEYNYSKVKVGGEYIVIINSLGKLAEVIREIENEAKSLDASINKTEQMISHLKDILDNGFRFEFYEARIELPCTVGSNHFSDKIKLDIDDMGMLLTYQEEKLTKQKREFKKLVIQ